MLFTFLYVQQSYGAEGCLEPSKVYPEFAKWLVNTNVDQSNPSEVKQYYEYITTDFLGKNPEDMLVALTEILKVLLSM